MRTMKRASGAAAVALLALTLGACSDAEDAADKAADDAREKAGEAGSSLAADASDKAGSALSDATGGADSSATSGTGGTGDGSATDGSAGSGDVGGVALDLGEFATDPSAKAVGEFYSAREEVRGGGDGAALEAVTGADHYRDVLAWAEGHPSSGSFTVVVTAVDGSSVSACVGEDGEGPRVLTVEDGKVTDNARGDFDC
ncbi:hypothetical protein CFH99_12800 [Nocardioides aromaticivorans]|uniref:Lipoprotein n=1 Tax=Nocardioides aromaticivorans TaxID=200618 RepID=A0ABX7PL50_9ACTN|nr:hypothetical protein [Nocardioides aromaticivorans]QSR26502.1 hypothetical protein CFH99_12800 [Nocardioides aromaticivorans]